MSAGAFDAPALPSARDLARLGLNTTGATSFRNRVRNGAFGINQRAVAGTVTLAAGAYGHDGWKAGANGCTYSAATSGGLTLLTITAGSLLQVVEASHIGKGGPYALSWTGTAPGRVYQSGAPAYAPTPRLIASGLAAGSAVTVEFGVGTLGLVQLEPGIAPSPFEHRDDELRRCQRYAAILQDRDNLGGIAGNSAALGARFALPVEMRAAPAVSILTSGSWYVTDDFSADPSATTVTLVGQATSGRTARLILGGFSGLTAQRWYGGTQPTGTARLLASAEL